MRSYVRQKPDESWQTSPAGSASMPAPANRRLSRVQLSCYFCGYVVRKAWHQKGICSNATVHQCFRGNHVRTYVKIASFRGFTCCHNRCVSHLAALRGFIGAARLSQQSLLACLDCAQSPLWLAARQLSIQGSRHEGQPAEMLRMQQELTAAHKLVAHLKIELDAAHGRLDIFRLQLLLLYYPLSTCLSMS